MDYNFTVSAFMNAGKDQMALATMVQGYKVSAASGCFPPIPSCVGGCDLLCKGLRRGRYASTRLTEHVQPYGTMCHGLASGSAAPCEALFVSLRALAHRWGGRAAAQRIRMVS